MSQTHSIDAPAPWWLHGRGYITMLRFDEPLSDEAAFVPQGLRAVRRRSRYATMMFVDYADSPVGPYHELLFIPGRFRFADGLDHQSITRIFVSSQDSVVNGNVNWGIPKDLAQFDVRYRDGGLDKVTVSRDGQVFAELAFKRWPLPIPVLGLLIPPKMRTLGQLERDQHYIYTPRADGIAMPGALASATIDGAVFPDITQGKAVMTVYLPYFRMLFAPSRLFPAPSDTATVGS